MEGVDIVNGVDGVKRVDADTAQDGCLNCPFLGARLSLVNCLERLSRELLVSWTEVSEMVEMAGHCSLSVSVSKVGGFQKSSFSEREQ